MDVVDDEQAGRQKDRDGGSVCLLLRERRRGFDEAAPGQRALSSGGSIYTQVESVCEHQLGGNDCGTLEVDGLPAFIAQVFDLKHGGICISTSLRQYPFEVGEEGRVVQRPFRGILGACQTCE